MPLDGQHERWIQRSGHIRDLIDQLLYAWPADGRVLLRSTLDGTKQALSEYRQQAEGDVPADEQLRGVVAPLIEILQGFQRVEHVADSSELRKLLTQVRDAAEHAFLTISDESIRSPQTVDQVIEDFSNEYRASLILALTANYALTQTVTHWYESQLNSSADLHHLDLRTMEFVAVAGAGTIPMSVLATSMASDPVVLTPTTIAATLRKTSTDNPPPIFRMAYTQWFSTVIATWEDTYRPRLATAHGHDEQGNAWEKNDVQSEFFYDLSQIRHDISHHAGVCVESAGNTVIDWLQLEVGKPIAPTTSQMLSFLDNFPSDELRHSPRRIERTTRPLPYQFDLAWLKKVTTYVATVEPVKRERFEVVRRVIDTWMDASDTGDSDP